MAHTLICHTNSLKENQEKAKRNVFKFHLFIPHTFYLQSQICSELRRDKKYKKDQRFGFGGLLGVRFKFVISHVQVNIKMLLVHCFCRQHRFGAGQTPCSLLNFFKRGLEIGRPACSSMQSFHCTEFSSPALCLLSLSTRGKKEEQLWESAILCLFSVMSEESSPIATPHSHSYDFCLD